MGSLRVMTWNVRGHRRPPIDQVAARIRDVAPDLVALQEVRARAAEEIAAAVGLDHRAWALKHRPGGPLLAWLPFFGEGLALLSSVPVLASTHHEVSRGASISSHERRIVQFATFDPADGEPLLVVNVHLAAAGGAARHEQAGRLAERLAGGANDTELGIVSTHLTRTVVVGDFNVDEDPAVFGPLDALGLSSIGRRVGPTYPAGAADRRLDHVLATGDLHVADVRIPVDGPDWAELSDHLPVIVDFTWD